MPFLEKYLPVSHKEDPSLLFKAQAEDTIHSGFSSLISAVNAPTEGYVLESINKLFGEKSARFRKVSKPRHWNSRALNLQWSHFQSCCLGFTPTGRVRMAQGSLRLPKALVVAADPVLPLLVLLQKRHLQGCKSRGTELTPRATVRSQLPLIQSL